MPASSRRASVAATAVLLQVGSLGNVRTTTMEAFDRAAFDRIVSMAG